MKRITDYIKTTPFFQQIITQYKSKKELHLTNATDQVGMVLLLTMFKELKENLVVVAPNLYQAQKLYDTLSNIVSTDQIAFFPQDELITTEMLAMSNEFKLERINTIQHIIEQEYSIVVTNTTGYIKHLMPKERWQKAKIELHKESIINLRQLEEKLIYYGYTREHVVENQGQFSVRGGIVDIFPINSDEAVRIDLFDDEIDSIRTFDVASQRSNVQTNNVEIYPMFELFYTDNEFQRCYDNIQKVIDDKQFSNKTIDRVMGDLENLKQRNNVDQLSRYMFHFNMKTETIQDYMGNHNVIYFDHKKIQENYETVVMDIAEWYDSTGDYPKVGFDLINDMNYIYSEKSLYLDVFGDTSLIDVDKKIPLNTKDAITYNNNLHMAIKDFEKYKGFSTTIIHFKTKQKRRQFTEYIHDKVPYYLIGTNDSLVPKQLNLVVEDESISFEWYNINVISLNETNLFHKAKTKKAKYQANLKDAKRLTSLDELKKGDYVVHYDHGIGRFLGVETMTLGDYTNDYVHISYSGDDSLFLPVENITLIQKYVGSEGIKPKLNKLGSSKWAKTKQRVRKRVKNIAGKLIKLYAAREESKGFSYSKDTELQYQFEAEFPYNETPDQLQAIEEIKRDMESEMPMDRLLCGDVGYGKTEVALRAAFKAVLDNKQVAYLAPTTVLSRQHYYTFKDRLEHHGIKVELLNRFIIPAKQRQVLKNLENGTVDIVIGTHRILSKDMKFFDLGLLIIDEEQRFGVEHKEKIKEIKVTIDVLSLSATPIPRTLQMAIMGVKSMSVLETPPENRYPIQTYVLDRQDSVIRDAIQREIARNGQVFYLYNRVDDINIIANHISRLVPEARVVYAHGKMKRVELENVIEAFLNKDFDVLVSTTIIETGIDIPNANTLLIHEADRLGLSQLYQIRGRVGRSDKIAYAYLMYKKHKALTEEALKRLKVIKEFTELGSGFKIAMRDLSIRGAGDILGTEQSGFMDSVGLDLYLDMLKDEIAVQRGEQPIQKEQQEESSIKVQVSKYIDSNYIQNDYVKIEVHRKIAKIESKQDIEKIKEELNDRFGIPPKEIILYMYEKLFEYLAKQKQVEKIRQTKNDVQFKLSKEQSTMINGDYLFTKANEITKHIRFKYRNNQLEIIIDRIKLKKHYLYYAVDVLELI